MKRFLSIMLVLVMILAVPGLVCACKSEETTKKKKKKSSKKTKITTEQVIDTVETDDISSSTDEPSDHSSDPSDETFQKDIIPTSSYDCPVETIGPHEIPEYVYEDITIADTEIWNQDGLSIHIYGYNLGMGTTRSLEMRLDNQTGHPVRLNLEKIQIDGFSELALWLKDFDNGTSTDFELDFFQTTGDYIGLWSPGRIDLSFEVEYTDTEATYKTGQLTAYTSVYDANKTYDFPYAVLIYDQDGIRISVLDFFTKNYGDSALLFYIENNSQSEIRVSSEETLINGISVDIFMYQTLSPGDKAIGSVTIRKDKLDEANIKDIETIGMILSIQKDGDYKSTVLCDPFTISVK